MTERGSLHALTWGWWALAAVVSVQLAPSPTYVALVIAVAALVVETHAPAGPYRRAFPVLVTVATVFVGVRVLLTALTAGTEGHVLVTLPQGQLPTLLGGFAVGGPIHTAVVLRTAAEGLAIVGIVAAFGAFNAIVSHHELIQAAPRAFHEVGVVVTVALAFVPSTIAAIAAVREADRARTGGRVVRRGRVLRTLVPVLEGGMERAVNLAESMDSRGFGHRRAQGAELAAGWLAALALCLLGGGFVALVGGARSVAVALGGAGAVVVGVAAVAAGRVARRPRHRPRRLGLTDAVAMAAVTAAPTGLVVLRLGGDLALAWDVAAGFVPPFEPVVALPLAALALPALWPRRDPAGLLTDQPAGGTP